MEENIVLPVDFQEAAPERALFRVERMRSVNGVIVEPPGPDDGRAQLGLPTAVPVEPAKLGPGEKRIIALGVVGIVAERTAEIIDLRSGQDAADGQIEVEVIRELQAGPAGQGEIPISVLFC